MIYFITTLLVLLGVAFHVMQKIASLRVKFPEFEPSKIFSTFFKQEWDSLIVSVLVLIVYETFLFLSLSNKFVWPVWLGQWGVYVLSVVIGYAGQRLAYKYLQTAESVLEKKAENVRP